MKIILALIALILLSCVSARAQVPKPQIVMIVADDLRPEDLPYLPSLAQIAARGVSFGSAITTYPLCTPSRSMLLTGLSQVTTGVIYNDAGLIDVSLPTLGTRLQAAGYQTAFLGKVYNKMRFLSAQPLPGWNRWWVFQHHNDLGREQTNILANRVGDWLGDCKATGQPCFTYIAPVSPHGPLPGPAMCDANTYPPSPYPEWASEWHRRMNSLCGLDHLIAKTIARMPPDAIFIFVGDNGFTFANGKLGKDQLVFDALHIPLMIAGPGIPHAEDRHELVSLLDLHATILDLAGIPLPANLDGQSMVPLLHGSTADWMGQVIIEAFPNPGEDGD